MSNGTAAADRRRTLIRTGTLIGLLLWLPGATADPLTREFVAVYDLKGLFTFGETTYRLNRRPGGRWRIEAESVATGALGLLNHGHSLQRSDWELNKGIARPIHYLDENTLGTRDKVKEHDFQWPAGKAIFTKKGKRFEVAITDGELDPLLYQLVLRRDLSEDPKLKRNDYHYRIVEGRKVNDYHFKVVGRAPLKVPFGEYEAVELVRVGDKRQTRFWCAPALDYLPLKIVQTERDGDEYTAVLKALSGITPSQ